MTDHVPVFAGDGAAPAAVLSTVDLLESLGLPIHFDVQSVDEHADRLDRGVLPDAIRRTIDGADAVLFGASGGRHGPVLQYLRREYGGGTFANVRPITAYPGAASPLADPCDVDYVVVRENLQGLYLGVDGAVADLRAALRGTTIDPDGALGAADPGTFDVRAHGEDALRRFAAFAADHAAEFDGNAPDGATRLTCASKSNVLDRTDGAFDEAVAAAVEEREGVAYEHLHVDDAAQQLVRRPSRFDVVVTPNLFGDILSDLGAGTVGGLGLAPSGCYGEDVAYFEPVHGTAPDIAGDGVINPTATILSAAMLLEYLDLDDAARTLRNAVAATYADGERLTSDQGGSASTAAFAETVAEWL